MEYLLNYMEDYEIEYLKEQYTDEIISLMSTQKDNVINKINKLLEQGEDDIYSKMSENIEFFIET